MRLMTSPWVPDKQYKNERDKLRKVLGKLSRERAQPLCILHVAAFSRHEAFAAVRTRRHSSVVGSCLTEALVVSAKSLRIHILGIPAIIVGNLRMAIRVSRWESRSRGQGIKINLPSFGGHLYPALEGRRAGPPILPVINTFHSSSRVRLKVDPRGE